MQVKYDLNLYSQAYIVHVQTSANVFKPHLQSHEATRYQIPRIIASTGIEGVRKRWRLYRFRVCPAFRLYICNGLG